MNKYLLVAFIALFISCCSQVMLKISSGEKKQSIIYEYLNVKVLMSYFATFGCMLLTIYSLKGIPYKYVVVIESCAYAIIMVLSRIFLKERITKQKVVGNLIIIAGVIIFTL